MRKLRQIQCGLATAVVLVFLSSCGLGGSGEFFATELHYAVEQRDFATVTRLLDTGADVNATDSNGRTPLHYAAAFNDLEMVYLLFERGATLQLRDKDKFTPRGLAGAYGAAQAEEMLLELED